MAPIQATLDTREKMQMLLVLGRHAVSQVDFPEVDELEKSHGLKEDKEKVLTLGPIQSFVRVDPYRKCEIHQNIPEI